ncbi:hypothetical protein M2T78_12530 [Elizabethkingia ursingii]|uniref:hypothetical protein n=1 Tax=Elizabethkingia ursingii TaxID=1756150 RepID=UPI0020124BEB|nr:hypothetical protein [Elizabethkingia ursingii]MCL1665086.1 hypothetical protein [Elizabethkingia ursingii]
MKVSRHYKNFLTAIFIAIYAFAVSPAEYLHNHLFHNFDTNGIQHTAKHGDANLKKAASSCDGKCPICNHKLIGEEGNKAVLILDSYSGKFSGKISSFVPEFSFSKFFSLAVRGPPVLL